jgi:uncharacterized cupin superfamily protein
MCSLAGDWVSPVARTPDRAAGQVVARLGENAMSNAILVTAANAARLESAPIAPDRILAGTPVARSKILASSQDRTTQVITWECSAGEFVWNYPEDETVFVISGEAFVTNDAGEECRLAEGHVAYFPGGSSSRWRVISPIKKVAVLRKDLPRPVGFVVRVWHKLLRISGLREGGSLNPATAGPALSGVMGEARGS